MLALLFSNDFWQVRIQDNRRLKWTYEFTFKN